ncbi:hypothetical protein R5R35_010170 [Gryllus longicercus]|uniref:Senescence-associated protein n=1 Tax=Gryllus longicercus TaxID=2509291 RepID=A0AAN9VEQ8_9ORTH
MIGRADIEGSKSDVAMNAWPPQASYPCGNFSDTSCRKLFEPKGSIDRAFAARARTERPGQASFCSFTLREVSVLAELALGHLRYLLTDVPPQSNSRPECVLGSDHAGGLQGGAPGGTTGDSRTDGRDRERAERRARANAHDAPTRAAERRRPKGGGSHALRDTTTLFIARLVQECRAGEAKAAAARLQLHRVSKETMKVVVFQRRRRSVSHLCYTSHVSLQIQTRVKLNRVFFPR